MNLITSRSPAFKGWKAGARQLGMTLLELMLAAAVVGLLMAIAIPAYRGVTDRMKVSKTVQDLLTIASQVERYRGAHDFRLPDSLADLTGVPLLDPWKHPYAYLSFAGSNPGKIRKDHNLHPLNTEYDLYSKGPDGDSKAPLTASASRDDIIWARDGGFVGKAADF